LSLEEEVMRKAKSKEKREIKHNEKKPVPKFDVDKKIAELKELEFICRLYRLYEIVRNHQEIWRKELKDDGFLKANYKIWIGQVKNLSLKIFNQIYGEEKIMTSDELTMGIMNKVTIPYQKALAEEMVVSKIEKAEKLPAGFIATVASWADNVEKLTSKRFYDLSVKYAVLEEIKKIGKLTGSYLKMVNNEILN
jgi:hypothetical protein